MSSRPKPTTRAASSSRPASRSTRSSHAAVTASGSYTSDMPTSPSVSAGRSARPPQRTDFPPSDIVRPVSDRLPPTRQDLIRWAEALSGIARTGLGFTESLYERERFEEVLAVAGDIRAAATADEEFDAEDFVEEW